MQNNNICIYPFLTCNYNGLDFYLIFDESTANSDTDLAITTDEPGAYKHLDVLSKLVLAKLPQAKVKWAELVSRAKLDEYTHLSSCPLIFKQQSYGKIVAKNSDEVELVAYYLSESNIIRLPHAELPPINFHAQLEEQHLTISAWQEVTLIERQSYLSCSLTSPELNCNMYCSSDLATQLCNITKISEFDANCHPELNKFIQLFNQALSCSLRLTAQWQPRFNHLGNYLKILLQVNGIAGYVLIDKWGALNSKTTGASSNKSLSYNSLLDLVMPFPLVHGETMLTLAELSNLKPGDVILFDNPLAPEYAKIDFSSLNYKFKLEKEQMIFCEVSS